MNSKYFTFVLLSCIVIFSSCSSSSSAQTNSTQNIVNSVKEFSEATSPFFNTKYVKADDGKDLKFIDYLINEIDKSQIIGDDYYLATALSAFSSIIASLSKEDAKNYGIENTNNELIKSEYQRYLFLSPANSSSRADYISIYLTSIRSISFHLKVKHIPVYEDLDNLINYISSEINNNQNTLNESDLYKVNLMHCNFLFSIALDDYAKYLIVGGLETDVTDYPFTELANQRIELLPKADDFSEMSKKISLLNNNEYSEIINKSSEIVVAYFSIINNAIRLITKE